VEGLTMPPATPAAKPEPEEDRSVPARRRRRDEDDEDADEDEEDEELDEEEQREKDEELRRRLMGEGEDEEEDEEEEDDDRPLRTRRKGKAKLKPAAWQKVRLGAILVVVSAGLLAGALLARQIVVLIGLVAGHQYGIVLIKVHPDLNPEEKELNLPKLIVALIGGVKKEGSEAGVGGNTALVIVGQVLELLSHAALIAGFAICLGGPSGRFGMRGLAMAGLVVASFNVLTTVVFKLLPQLGAMKFTLVPLLGPELAMLSANEERTMPLQLFWGEVPYLQVIVSLLLISASYLELVLFPLYLRAAAKWLKSERLENSALALVELALGQVFIQMAYQMIGMTGTSDVLGWVLRSVYGIGLGFFILQLTWYILLCLGSRTVVQTALDSE
jgi:hypothetical protein